MWFTPASTARLITASASSRSFGGPKTPGPGSCMAPKPMRRTVWVPSVNVSVGHGFRYTGAPTGNRRWCPATGPDRRWCPTGAGIGTPARRPFR